MANLKYIGKNILNHELEVKSGNIIGDHTEVSELPLYPMVVISLPLKELRHQTLQSMKEKLIGLTNQIAQMILIHLDLVLQKTELGVVVVLTQQELPHTEHLV